MYSCLDTCDLNRNHVTLRTLRTQERIPIHRLDETRNGQHYILEFAPVGNIPEEPIVIICGKTPGKPTVKRFMSEYAAKGSIEDAAHSSVYSEMRDRLYKGLSEKTRFFDFLGLASEYWRVGDRKELWDKIFTDIEASRRCDIQLTQVCNCSVHTNTSDEPTPKAFKEIEGKNPKCLFRSLLTRSRRLKLIVFLDTPSSRDGRYHHQKVFENTQTGRALLTRGVKIASLPHPSGSDRAYNKGVFDSPPKMKQAFPNAHRAFGNLSEVIEELIKAAR